MFDQFKLLHVRLIRTQTKTSDFSFVLAVHWYGTDLYLPFSHFESTTTCDHLKVSNTEGEKV